MKAALTIYLFMLALVGSLAWRMGGSPFLLAVSMVVVLVYGLLSIRLRQVAEISRIVISALLVSLCPLYYENDPIVFWLCLLALPQLLSATQCIWEIQHADTTKEFKGISIRRSIFTLGFYATLGLAFLMLRAELLEIERSTGIMLALVITLLGLVAWELGRVRHLKNGKTANTLSNNGFLFRIALAGVGSLIFALLFAVVLPFAADSLCYFSSNLELPRNLSDSGARRISVNQPGKSAETQSNEESDSDGGPEIKNRRGQSRLPMRGKIELSDEVRVVLKFEDSTEAETLTQQGPLYVRTLAVSKFKDDQWVSESSSGYWVKDANDENHDGKVEIRKPLPGEIAHEVFIPQSSGYVLPALSGVTTYALPELFVLPDDWFQNVATGDIRYKAWSKPVNILSLPNLKLEAGSPGEAYTAKLNTPFGTKLTEITKIFRTQRTDLAGRLNLLHQHFQKEFKYSITVENKSGLPPLENFLFEEKKGYCDFFASAAALMLRHMGIPSRVAYGYKEGEYDTTTDTWIFRELHAHAWTEVFVEDHGWIICDFTPPSADSSARSGSPPPFDMAQFKDAGEPSTEDEIKLWNKTQFLQSLRSLWLPAILGFGLLGGIVSFLFGKRHTPVQRATAKAAREQAGRESQPEYFLEFLRMCEALGHTRMKGQTLMDFHRRLKHSQFCDDHFDDLADYYYKSRYEDAPLDKLSEHDFLKRIHEFWKAKTQKTEDK